MGKVQVDLRSETTPFEHFWEVVFGSERLFIVLRENILEHYRIGHEELGLEYVRAHGVFHDEMGVYRESTKDGNSCEEFSHLVQRVELNRSVQKGDY